MISESRLETAQAAVCFPLVFAGSGTRAVVRTSVWLGGRVLLAAPACFGGPAYRAGATKFPSHSARFGSPGVGASRHAAGILAGADVAGRGNRVLVDRWQGVGGIGGGTQTKLVAGTYVDRGFSWGGFGPCVRWIRHRTGRDFRSRRNHLSLEVDGSGVLALGWAWVVGAGCSDCAVAVAEADAARRSSWQGVDGITTRRR